MKFEIKENKILKVKNNEVAKNSIYIFKNDEWQKNNNFLLPKTKENIHFCKIEDAKQYLYGTLFIPLKNKYPKNVKFYFYLINENIVFIDDSNLVMSIINEIVSTKSKNNYNVIKFLHDFLEILIKDDLVYLQKLEEKLSKLEDSILEKITEGFNKKIISSKKEILRFYHYYGQLLNMIDTLLEKDSTLHSIFDVLRQKISRFQNETSLLREYTHQLQHLYESQISMHQNDIMKVLTIVTTIFLPLTLITGWYGMNFKYMPELSWVFGYPMVIILFALVVITCLIIFKKKKFW